MLANSGVDSVEKVAFCQRKKNKYNKKNIRTAIWYPNVFHIKENKAFLFNIASHSYTEDKETGESFISLQANYNE